MQFSCHDSNLSKCKEREKEGKAGKSDASLSSKGVIFQIFLGCVGLNPIIESKND